MKLVCALIPAASLDALRDVLVAAGVKGMTVSDAAARPDEAAGCMVETVIDDALLHAVVKTILAVCGEDTPGNVPMRISDVLYGVRIRNAERVTEG
ncbi:P-II family nitrogen regulator [Paraburkholderia sp. SOS3]|jgi:nitrogen regulatory protein PII|uniref:P-II family nitrogen regulator n=1 Tax=Paraburkholderia sp. SOS3 TaxID=1926494 RepID=UPI0009472E16|nr:P-II family nitrogen regulator [Paraburkholderia sp. SOS3]APR39338.1 hypothetical protein BTO02_29015 [Paraburkholderia sp. SOS3]